jgi:hypothetical protein
MRHGIWIVNDPDNRRLSCSLNELSSREYAKITKVCGEPYNPINDNDDEHDGHQKILCRAKVELSQKLDKWNEFPLVRKVFRVTRMAQARELPKEFLGEWCKPKDTSSYTRECPDVPIIGLTVSPRKYDEYICNCTIKNVRLTKDRSFGYDAVYESTYESDTRCHDARHNTHECGTVVVWLNYDDSLH